MEEIVFLLLIDVIARLVLDVLSELLQGHLPVHDTHHIEETLLDLCGAQQSYLLLDRERHVGAYKVERHDVVVNIAQGEGSIFGDVVVDFYIVDT